jgi:hypothetical protein
MPVNPYDPEAPALSAPGQTGGPRDVDSRTELRTSPDGDENIDEPGYGHGV